MDEQFESNLQRAAQLCPMLASIRIMRPNQTLNDVERAQIACIFVRHSMERKDMLRLDWNSSLARSLYQLRHRGLYSYTIQGGAHPLRTLTTTMLSHAARARVQFDTRDAATARSLLTLSPHPHPNPDLNPNRNPDATPDGREPARARSRHVLGDPLLSPRADGRGALGDRSRHGSRLHDR
eukprot:3503700-Prymnesium_polylepis.1